MNVVMIGPFGLKKKSTMRERALPMARALVRRGHRVTLIVPPWDSPEDAGQITTDAGVEIVHAPLPTFPAPLFHLALTRWLVKHALQRQPDIIHLFKPKAYAGLAHLFLHTLKRLKRHRVGLVVDEDDWERAWNALEPYSRAQKLLFSWQEPWGLTHADAVTVASKTLQSFTETLGVAPETIFYVPNGVRSLPGNIAAGRVLSLHRNIMHLVTAGSPEPQDYPPYSALSKHPEQKDVGREYHGAVRARHGLHGTPLILLYTRFFEFNLPFLVDVMRDVHRQLPSARWLVVGTGLFGEDEKLRRMIADTPLATRVIFAGWVEQSALPDYFSAANIAVYPYDDTPLNRTKCSVKLIDLLAAGVPVVASNVGQNREYISQNESGILVPAGDARAMAEAITTLLTHEALQEMFAVFAMRTINEKFNWNTLISAVEAAYQTAIARQ